MVDEKLSRSGWWQWHCRRHLDFAFTFVLFIPTFNNMSPSTSSFTATASLHNGGRNGGLFASHRSNSAYSSTSQPGHKNNNKNNNKSNNNKNHTTTDLSSSLISSSKSTSNKTNSNSNPNSNNNSNNNNNNNTSKKKENVVQVPFSYPEHRRARVASKPVAMNSTSLQPLNNKHYVFTYGTLKRGFPNSHLLDRATYLGEYRTVVSYPLVVAAPYFVPYLLNIPHSGSRVKGEMYAVDDATLADLDHLERVASSNYSRLVAPVASCKDRATVVHAFVYFKTNGLDELVKNKFHDDYQCRRYVPRHLR